MSDSNGHDVDQANSSSGRPASPCLRVEAMLFESLVHHLMEKGVLTKNDALSVVGTVAAVKRGQLDESNGNDPSSEADLAMLHRMFESFKAIDVPAGRMDGANVHQLRPPLHGDQVDFPRDD